jgi:NitT/TauT family transport system substrate-binding protein
VTRRTFLMLMTAALALAACAPAPAGPTPVRIGVLPILEALPMYVANAEGLFEKEGLQVELVPVASAAERDQLMQSGQIDGMINDLVSTALYNAKGPQITIVRLARAASTTDPQYRVLAAKDSGIKTVGDLAGVPIGISEGTVIEYVTDRLLEAEGLSPDQITFLAVPKIPDRLALLDSGELRAATLPDPLASLAIAGGATVVVDDTTHPEYGNSVISFSRAFLDAHPDAVRGFLAALEDATNEINGDKSRWGDLLTEQKLVPAPLLGSYVLPDFPKASIPTEAQFDDVVAWEMGKGLISAELHFADSVDGSFLPKNP